MVTNTTSSFSRQDQAHGANTIEHLLIMSNNPSTPLSYQRIWVPSSSQYLLSYPSGSCLKNVLGATQNQNESFNNIIWSGCPKTGFCSLVGVEIAVSLAVITFNHGLEGLSPLFEQLLGSPPRTFISSDEKRIKNAEQKARCTSQRRRKSLRSTELAT